MNPSKKEINTFILSTGRAGTTLLSRNIETMDVNVSNLHQDENSRYINALSNALLKLKFFKNIYLNLKILQQDRNL